MGEEGDELGDPSPCLTLVPKTFSALQFPNAHSLLGSSCWGHKLICFPPINLQASGSIQSQFTLSLKGPRNFNGVV
jgi:hypothetical protein